ncbi:FAD binding domain-containing protein [Desulforhopalus singaporensis]|uniref:Carbon-monoxide dehydrogenase medium subunit n=1 Tax=Desulforhopalus singaporensis TaxID=91360 RepID=A0A1H0ISJ5_9BACT|nr:xanthine dehydrogenase family protein subunit M [Desulforhopalus singaporensis]SDO34322.1 carbon-monoxide dehydrogenase medium subunit [Desulforhopalus singaporensis]
MKQFHYHEPKTVEEACLMMAELGDNAKLIAGGTDLVVQMNRGAKAPSHVVSVKTIQGLDSIIENEEGFRIGAATLLADISDHKGMQSKLPMLCSAARSIGSAQVRNLSTVGGNICNAAPSADMAPGLLALNAIVTIAGHENLRTLPLEEFFVGPGIVNLEKGEILTEIFVPTPTSGTQQVYLKHGPRRAMDCAVVGVAVTLLFEQPTGRCQQARIALGAVGPTPLRAKMTEKLLVGKTFNEFPLDRIAELAAQEASPISDVRASADYRCEMVSTFTKRAIVQLASFA